MKILFVTPSVSFGGAERVVSVLSNELVDNGHSVTILSYFKTENEYTLDSRVKIIYLSGGNEAFYNKMNYYQRFTGIRRIVKSENPDAVIPFLSHVCMQVAIALFGTRFKVIQTIRNNPYTIPASKFRRFLRDFFVLTSSKTIVQNESQKMYFKKCLHKKIYILPNPVREDLFQVEKNKKTDTFIVASAGRLTRQKNFFMLIDAFELVVQSINNVVLRIYGDGELKDDLQDYINKKGLYSKVKLMGRTNNMNAMLSSIDIYVMSSNFEGMPNSLMEAMAAGVPCVSTDCPTGPSDLIEDGKTGLLVPINDSEAMAEAIKKMFFSIDKDEIAKQGKSVIKKNYNPKKIVSILLSILER